MIQILTNVVRIRMTATTTMLSVLTQWAASLVLVTPVTLVMDLCAQVSVV